MRPSAAGAESVMPALVGYTRTVEQSDDGDPHLAGLTCPADAQRVLKAALLLPQRKRVAALARLYRDIGGRELSDLVIAIIGEEGTNLLLADLRIPSTDQCNSSNGRSVCPDAHRLGPAARG